MTSNKTKHRVKQLSGKVLKRGAFLTDSRFSKINLAVFALIFAGLGSYFLTSPAAHAAGTASLSLSPSSSSVTAGSNLVLNVSLNSSGSSVNTIQSELSYPSANFSLVSIVPVTPFDGAFPTPITSTSGGNNLIDFAAGTTTPFSGTQNVVTITLRANSAGSSLPITLASVCASGNYALNCSAAYDASTSVNDLSTVSGGTYTVSAGTPAPTVSLTANPTTITSGSSSTLTWSVTNSAQSNPTGCTASGAWSGAQATSGTQSVSPTTTSTYTITCTGPGGTSTPANATVTVNQAAGCYQSTTSWQNNSFTSKTASFTFDFDSTPAANNINSVVGLNNTAAAAYTDLAAIVRFNDTGTIDAYNNTAYAAAATVPYTAGTAYHFKLTVNPTAHTYTVVVTPNGGSATTLATNYAFRSSQATLSTFSNWALFQDPGSTGSQTACNAVAATVTGGVIGDLNADGHVNVFDLSIFLTHWQQSGSGLPEDFNNDNVVNIFDLSILLSHYGA